MAYHIRDSIFQDLVTGAAGIKEKVEKMANLMMPANMSLIAITEEQLTFLMSEVLGRKIRLTKQLELDFEND